MILQDKVVLITGAGGALGRALVEAVRRHGGTPFGTDLRAVEGVDVVHDVTSPESWSSVLAEVEARFGRLDGLVNNAGIISLGNVETTALPAFQKMMQVNVEGVFLGCQASWPLLRKSKAAAIVNVSSTAGLIGSPNHLAYVASKGAVRLMSKSVALHGATMEPPIRCNSLHPSLMEGDMARILVGEQPDPDAAIAALAKTRSPMGRLAETSEVADAACFLLSSMSGYVTGSELVSDGGATAQ